MNRSTRHAIVQPHDTALMGKCVVTTQLKFHCPFTLEEADDLLTQAEAKRDELDKQYAGMIEGIAWFSKHELQPKRPFKSLAFYLAQLEKIQLDIQRLTHAIDEATRGADSIVSQKMWELAERMGLQYPQIEAQHE
ncbi:hypothetical protein D3C85_552660 [compost metagenome]